MEEEFPVYLYCRFWLHIDRNMGSYLDVRLLSIESLTHLYIDPTP